MTYVRFNEGVLLEGYKAPNSYYKLCEDIISYIEKDIGNIEFNSETPGEKFVKDNKIFKKSIKENRKTISKNKLFNKSHCRIGIELPEGVSYNKAWKIIEGMQSKFNLKSKKPSRFSEVYEICFYRRESDGSYTSINSEAFTKKSNDKNIAIYRTANNKDTVEVRNIVIKLENAENAKMIKDLRIYFKDIKYLDSHGLDY